MVRVLCLLFASSVANVRAEVATTISASPPLASNPADVVASAATSFGLVGGVSFVWTSASYTVMRRAQPLKAGVQAAQRWGRISAGFVGGRNIGQVVRKTDDLWCSTAGAVVKPAHGGGGTNASSMVVVGVGGCEASSLLRTTAPSVGVLSGHTTITGGALDLGSGTE